MVVVVWVVLFFVFLVVLVYRFGCCSEGVVSVRCVCWCGGFCVGWRWGCVFVFVVFFSCWGGCCVVSVVWLGVVGVLVLCV